jgi:hypothetical protein
MINGSSKKLLLPEDLLIRLIDESKISNCKETVLHTVHWHPCDNIKDWFKKNLMNVWEKEIWPPSSPARSPLDYFAWGDQGGDGVPRQEHRAKGLQAV